MANLVVLLATMACRQGCSGLFVLTVVACVAITTSTTISVDLTVYLHGSDSSDVQPTALLTDADPVNNLLDSVASEAALLFGSMPKAFAAEACSRWQGFEHSYDVQMTQAARPGRQQSLPGGFKVLTDTCHAQISELGQRYLHICSVLCTAQFTGLRCHLQCAEVYVQAKTVNALLACAGYSAERLRQWRQHVGSAC